MKIIKIADNNPLNGKSNEQARKILRNIVDKPSKGLFSDEYWLGPNNVFKALSYNNINYTIEKTEYGVSPNFQQSWTGEKWKIPNDFKEWTFLITFTNNNNKLTTLHCRLTAMGAGSVNNPLEKYDMSVLIG